MFFDHDGIKSTKKSITENFSDSGNPANTWKLNNTFLN